MDLVGRTAQVVEDTIKSFVISLQAPALAGDKCRIDLSGLDGVVNLCLPDGTLIAGNEITLEEGQTEVFFLLQASEVSGDTSGTLRVEYIPAGEGAEVIESNTLALDVLDGAYTPMQTTSAGTWDSVLLGPNVRSVSTGALVDNVTGTQQNDHILLGDSHDMAIASLGNDKVFGEGGNDYILAGLTTSTEENARKDMDFVVGGTGRDILVGGVGDDTLHGGEIGEHQADVSSTDAGDWLEGGSGADSLYGSQTSDLLQGGSGGDTVFGGGGDDVILGDGEIRQSIRTTIMQSSNPGAFDDLARLLGEAAGSQTAFWQEKYSQDGLGVLLLSAVWGRSSL
jgi:Ca2+-binding RTX toxin-like protein